MRELDAIRADLAVCDEALARQLAQRFGYVSELVEYKKAHGLPLLQPEAAAGEKRLAAPGDSGYREEILGVLDRVTQESRRVQSKHLFHTNLALIGFMGAGKSTVTACLKERLSMQEVEVDDLIVEQQQMSIKDIFANYGEPYFRDCESRAILSLQGVRQTVISCGGGAVMRPENVRALKQFCRIVLLTATPETTLQRVKDSEERPLLNGHMNVAYLSELMAQREGYYRAAADLVIATDGKNAVQICEELIGALVKLERTER